VGNDPVYSKTLCFDPFPFPVPTIEQQQQIREIAERLNAHRNRQQKLQPWLTLTEMYNVLEKLRAGTQFSEQDHVIHQAGLVSVLREIHRELDSAVFGAYGWPLELADEQILERVVALNALRNAEEAAGTIRWLRPEFQAPNASAMQQTLEDLSPSKLPSLRDAKQPWPATLTDQFRVIKRRTAGHAIPNPAANCIRFQAGQPNTCTRDSPDAHSTWPDSSSG